MKNRWKRQCYHGVITGYSFVKQNITVYIILYKKNRPVKKLTFKRKAGSLYYRLQNLPVYKKDGSLDLESLEGMRVYVELFQCNSRIKVKKITFDLSYYSSGGEERNG